MLSGFFFSPHRSLEEDAKRRGKSLLIPYLAWGFILIPITVVLFNFDAVTLVQQFLLGGSYAQRPLTTFWFLTALFAAALMYRALSRLDPAIVWAVVIAALLANVVYGEAMAQVPWSLATATGALLFMQVGTWIAQLHGRFSTSVVQKTSVGVLALCAMILVLVPGDFEPLRMKQGVFPPFAVVLSLFICGALISLGTTLKTSERTAEWATFLATPSLVVIALHPLLLIAFSGLVPYPLVPILAFSGSLAIGLLIVKLPVATILAGVPRS